jgi:hypothetical protein
MRTGDDHSSVRLHHFLEVMLGDERLWISRLKIYQRMKRAGGLPKNAYFFLIAHAAETIQMRRVNRDRRLCQIDRKLRDLESRLGLSTDEPGYRARMPPAWKELNKQYDAAHDQLMARILRQYGEGVMASLFLARPGEFQRRRSAGRRYFGGKIARIKRRKT